MIGRFPRAGSFVLGSLSAIILAFGIGIFERPPPAPPPPAVKPPPQITPSVVPVPPSEPRAPPATVPKRRVRRPKAPPPKKTLETRPVPPTISPFRARLAEARAAPRRDLKFELAADLKAAAAKLPHDDRVRVEACLTQFLANGAVRTLEHCVQRLEAADRGAP